VVKYPQAFIGIKVYMAVKILIAVQISTLNAQSHQFERQEQK
jgi:hypothetical protein